MEGNLDFCLDLVKFNIPMGHMEEVSGMKLDVWLDPSDALGWKYNWRISAQDWV